MIKSLSEMVPLANYFKKYIRTWKKIISFSMWEIFNRIWIQKRHENILHRSPSNDSITKYLDEALWEVIKNPQ